MSLEEVSPCPEEEEGIGGEGSAWFILGSLYRDR